jgi:hypothetical protein
MSTLNVGAMAARLGLDPSEFLDKMKGVQGFNGFVSGEMARQWKKTGRDGQEVLRLIDEALGIHVARPVARIVTETFPALGKALSSVLPGVAFSAFGFAILEFAEHIGAKMTEAKKKQDDYTDAVRKTTTVVAEARAESEKRLNATLGKDAGIRGDTNAEAYYKGLATDADNIERMAKFVDQLTDAMRREALAAAALMPWWAELDKVWDQISKSSAEQGVEKIAAQIKVIQDKFADLAHDDGRKHGHTAADYLNEQLPAAQKTLNEMAPTNLTLWPFPAGQKQFHVDSTGVRPGASKEEIEQQKKLLAGIKLMEEQKKRSDENARADKQLERDTEQKKRNEEIARGIEHIHEAQKRWQEETVSMGKELHAALDKKDELKELEDGFKTTMATLAQVSALMGGKAFFAEFGATADQMAQKLAMVTAHVESLAQTKKFFDDLHEGEGREPVGTKTPFPLGTPAMPTLVHGGAVAGELAAFAEEPRKQIEMMKMAYLEAMTPLQKFTVAQRELDLILKNQDGTFRAGAEGAAAYAGAMRHLVDEEIRAGEASKKATDGLHAFWLELQQGEKNGKFAFDLGSTMFRDIEDGIAKTILATRNQHAELRRMWENYFKGLEEMAIKFALSKSFASLANLGSPAGANGQSGASSAGGIAGLLAKLFGAFGLGGGGGAGGGAATASAAPGDIPLFAEGGDATPGSSFISGEAGMERVDLTRGGGARITPLGGSMGGSETNIHNDFRGTVMTDDLMRRAEALQAMRISEERSVARAVSMQSEIAKRSRPGR